MPCYSPLTGYRSRNVNSDTGKVSIVFNPRKGWLDLEVKVPCGQCIGCRLERSRQWAIRCVHEASLHSSNSFITLTYAPEFLPKGPTLVKKHFQDFMKRLRKRIGVPVRYFHCGEYGTKFARPHYHAIIFGYSFPDREVVSLKGKEHFISPLLASVWKKGFCTVGDVTFDSAAYVARYCTKKVNGFAAQLHYEYVDEVTGEFRQRICEYVTMSRRPGIAKGWFDLHKSDLQINDSVVMRGREMKPPKFYDSQFEICDPDYYEDMKRFRKLKASLLNVDDIRLRTVEKVKELNFKNIDRSYEND